MEEFMKKDIDKVFPGGESYYKALDLINKIRRLVPFNARSGIDYLDTIITYVDGLINGDDISQYTTYAYTSKYAKIAFREIMDDVHDQVLEEFRRERAELQGEVSTLSNQREVLSGDVEGLEKRKSDLQEQTGILSVDLARINRELEDARNNGMARVNAEVEEERDRLSKEIASLKETKEALASSVKELKGLLNEHSLTISKLDGSDEVIWKPIADTDPIYNTNFITIASFIQARKNEYMDKTGASKEVCDREFSKYMPGLNEFVSLLKGFNNDGVTATSSLKTILSYTNWSTSAKRDAESLRAMVSTFKVPFYQPKMTNIDTGSLTPDTIPTNINSMLRELYLQRIAIEAVTKQKLAEAELKSVIAVLKSVAPKDYDFRGLITMYSGLDNLLPGEFGYLPPSSPEEGPTLQL